MMFIASELIVSNFILSNKHCTNYCTFRLNNFNRAMTVYHYAYSVNIKLLKYERRDNAPSSSSSSSSSSSTACCFFPRPRVVIVLIAAVDANLPVTSPPLDKLQESCRMIKATHFKTHHDIFDSENNDTRLSYDS